jgi:hypothetical protein
LGICPAGVISRYDLGQKGLETDPHAGEDMTDEYVSDAFVYMREWRLPYSVFDADNHMYENRDALTIFLAPEYDGIIKYVDIGKCTKVAIKDKISAFIRNPTFTRWVATWLAS